MKCPKCGHSTIFDFTICKKCGYDLTKGQKIPQKPLETQTNELKKIKRKKDADNLAQNLKDRLKTNSLPDIQKATEIIRHLNDLSDGRGIESLPEIFKALYSCSDATPADRRRLGLAALQSCVNTSGDTSHVDALNKVGIILDEMESNLILVETTAPMLAQIENHKQSKAVVKELRKQTNSILANFGRVQKESAPKFLNNQNESLISKDTLDFSYFLICSGNSSIIEAYNELFKVVALAHNGIYGHYYVDTFSLDVREQEAAKAALSFAGQSYTGTHSGDVLDLHEVISELRLEASRELYIAFIKIDHTGITLVQNVYNELLDQAMSQGILPYSMYVTKNEDAVKFLLASFKEIS